MTRKKLKEILLEVYKSTTTINHILRGTRKPSYENILYMNKTHQVPFDAWKDIKSYLQPNPTKDKETTTTLQEQ